MKRILLTGCGGQIGAELFASLASTGRVIACDRQALDLTDRSAIVMKIRELRPDIIVNAAAYTAVDRAESETAIAHAVNAEAPATMAEEAAKLGALLVHYSTDYVFDGAKSVPYDEDDAPNPLNVYGRSKLAGEQAIRASGAAHLIFRTSWVYGARGGNFLLTMLKLAQRAELKIVNDQFGAPTWSRDVANATAAVLGKWNDSGELSGIFHLCAGGSTTWFDYAAEIFALTLQGKPQPRLLPVSTRDYAAAALRPRNSRLNCARVRKTFDVELPHWNDSLRRCIDVIGAA